MPPLPSATDPFAPIRQWGDPVLRAPARAVTAFDAALARQAAAMLAVLEGARGAGLAAPQVGSLSRLVVVRPAPDGPARALVNPEVEEASAEHAVDLEGCLSLARAQVHVEVARPRAVVVRARDLDGEELRLEAQDDEARLLQHEIDHLDGVLVLDRAAPEVRRAAVRALREHESGRSRA